jgi:hypothetical protein
MRTSTGAAPRLPQQTSREQAEAEAEKEEERKPMPPASTESRPPGVGVAYEFSGMHFIFDHHKKAITSIQYDRSSRAM